MRPIAAAPVALLLTAAAASSPANASVTWSGIQQDIYARFDVDGTRYEDSAEYNSIGNLDDTVTASATIGGQTASLSTSLTTEFTSNSISWSVGGMSSAPVGFPSFSNQYASALLALDFTLNYDAQVELDFEFMNTDAYAGNVLMTFEHDTDPTIGIFTDFLIDDTADTMNYALSAGDYSITVFYFGGMVADGIDRESEFNLNLTVIPAPASLAALVPLALAATRRRR